MKGELRRARSAELARLARYSESDKARAREAAKLDGSPKLRALLEAEQVKPKKKRRACRA